MWGVSDHTKLLISCLVPGLAPGPPIRPCQCTRWTLGKYLLLNWLSVVIPLFVSFQHLGCFFQHFGPKQPEFLFTIFWPYCGAQQPQAAVIWDWMRSKRIKFTVTIAWNIADLMWHHAADRIHCVNPTRPFIFVNFPTFKFTHCNAFQNLFNVHTNKHK